LPSAAAATIIASYGEVLNRTLARHRDMFLLYGVMSTRAERIAAFWAEAALSRR
jgi:hypothetical protein